MRAYWLIGAMVLAAWVTSSIVAQDGDKKKDKNDQGPEKPVEFEERYNLRYLQREPKVGTTIADIDLFDEAGNDWNIDATRGKYTVLVFGCLT